MLINSPQEQLAQYARSEGLRRLKEHFDMCRNYIPVLVDQFGRPMSSITSSKKIGDTIRVRRPPRFK